MVSNNTTNINIKRNKLANKRNKSMHSVLTVTSNKIKAEPSKQQHNNNNSVGSNTNTNMNTRNRIDHTKYANLSR